ncbi:unnamed protein product [Rodentolepis nana]|uniref:Cmyb_C domain-containing protein n=1 Tax=Rodentolepis nana TaxID=102285 RepID=A0A0R3TWD7_RODNA|nr:unnamed protein product [Rodentolepis nana]
MALVQPITPLINLDVKAAPESRTTLLSLALKRNREHQGQEALSPLDAIRSRIMEQRTLSHSKSLSSTPPPSNSILQSGESCVVNTVDTEDTFFVYPDKTVDEMQEDKDLIQI